MFAQLPIRITDPEVFLVGDWYHESWKRLQVSSAGDILVMVLRTFAQCVDDDIHLFKRLKELSHTIL